MKIEGHSTVFFQGSFYLFGGFDHSTGGPTNSLYRIDLSDVDRGDASASSSSPSSSTVGMDIGGATTSSSPLHLAGVRGSRSTLTSAGASGNDTATMFAVTTQGATPSPRAFHACTLRGPYMIVWGGTCSSGSETANSFLSGGGGGGGGIDGQNQSSSPPQQQQSVISNDLNTELFALNLESLTWVRYSVRSAAPHIRDQRVPQPRCHATLVCTEESLLLYGGYPSTMSGSGEACIAPNEWNVFSISSDGLCEAQEAVGASPALWGHSTVYSYRCMMVFGGIDCIGNEEVKSLCVYHVDEHRWRWAEFPEGPCARAMHSAVVDTQSGAMIVYGGFCSFASSSENEYEDGDGMERQGNAIQLNDVWAFSLETGLWERIFPKKATLVGSPLHSDGSELRTTGVPYSSSSSSSSSSFIPKARSGHSAACANGKMYVFGGLIEGDQDTQRRDSSGSAGVSSPPLAQRSNNNNIISSSQQDVVVFNIEKRTWTSKALTMSRSGPQGVSSSTAARQRSADLEGRSTATNNNHINSASTRESIIDRYLNSNNNNNNNNNNNSNNIQSRSSPNGSSLETRRVSGVRGNVTTVGSRFHTNVSDESNDSNALLASSEKTKNKSPSATNRQEDVIVSTMNQLRDEQRRVSSSRRSPDGSATPSPLQLIGRPPSGGDQQHPWSSLSPTAPDRNDYYRPHPLATLRNLSSEFSDVAAGGQWAASRGNNPSTMSSVSGASNTYGVARGSPPSSQFMREGSVATSTRVGDVVGAISRAQNHSDFLWTKAENERRAKLLMQYVQSQQGGGPSTPLQAPLQDDETPISFASRQSAPAVSSFGSLTPSPGFGTPTTLRDNRLLVPSPTSSSSTLTPSVVRGGLLGTMDSHRMTPNNTSRRTQRGAAVSSSPPPTAPLMAPLDSDEVEPSVYCSHPHELVSGPWRPLL